MIERCAIECDAFVREREQHADQIAFVLLGESEAVHIVVDVAIVDLGLPDGYGRELIEELRRVSPGAQALVLSATLDRREIAAAVQSGAAGFTMVVRVGA